MILKVICLHENANAGFQLMDYSFQNEKIFSIDGRLTCGTLKIGDVFNTLYNYNFIYDYTSMSYENIELLDERNILLEIQRICVYGHFIEEMESGLTARLFLTGNIEINDLSKYTKESWIEFVVKG